MFLIPIITFIAGVAIVFSVVAIIYYLLEACFKRDKKQLIIWSGIMLASVLTIIVMLEINTKHFNQDLKEQKYSTLVGETEIIAKDCITINNEILYVNVQYTEDLSDYKNIKVEDKIKCYYIEDCFQSKRFIKFEILK